MTIKIHLEDEKDAYVFLDLCRIIAKVSEDIKELRMPPVNFRKMGKPRNLKF